MTNHLEGYYSQVPTVPAKQNQVPIKVIETAKEAFALWTLLASRFILWGKALKVGEQIEITRLDLDTYELRQKCVQAMNDVFEEDKIGTNMRAIVGHDTPNQLIVVGK